MSFYSLKLSTEIVETLHQRGYRKPTPIQKEMIPVILEGRDILASAQTGTGKSAGFILPLLQKLISRTKEYDGVKILILAPTRELVKQLEEHIRIYSRGLTCRSMAVYGGSPVSGQAKRLKEGVDILVGTPGRVLEHVRQKNLDLRTVDHCVLDEADTILDMGFRDEVLKIMQSMKKHRQTILVSATLSGGVRELARTFLEKPKLIELAPSGTIAGTVRTVLVPVEKEKKDELLSYLIGSRNYSKTLVFVRKKEESERVSAELNASGLKTDMIHGGRSSGARGRALEAFREGRIDVLVATDIAARGLDIRDVEAVISYDFPHVMQDFIHRIGRTGRAGKKGLAMILNSPEEAVAAKSVERMLGKAFEREIIPGYEPVTNVQSRGPRKNTAAISKKTPGAFGKKKKNTGTTYKKRKTTKRDGFGGRR